MQEAVLIHLHHEPECNQRATFKLHTSQFTVDIDGAYSAQKYVKPVFWSFYLNKKCKTKNLKWQMGKYRWRKPQEISGNSWTVSYGRLPNWDDHWVYNTEGADTQPAI